MAFPQFAELWELIDLLVRKDFRQANLATDRVAALLPPNGCFRKNVVSQIFSLLLDTTEQNRLSVV
jgi:hypothetical protein